MREVHPAKVIPTYAVRIRCERFGILNISFESSVYTGLGDKDRLADFLHSKVPANRMFYVFLDGIQMVEGWEEPSGP